MKKLYVGCSLSSAPKEFIDSVERLKDNLRGSFEVLDFVGLQEATDKEVFEHDKKCVTECDLFLAICDHASLGLGYEIALANSLNKPTLAVAHKDEKVSRMILGISNKGFTFRRYSDFEEIPTFLKVLQ